MYRRGNYLVIGEVGIGLLQLMLCVYFGRAPPAGGSGFLFQVLATRASWLWAFHCNPSRKGYWIIF